MHPEKIKAYVTPEVHEETTDTSATTVVGVDAKLDKYTVNTDASEEAGASSTCAASLRHAGECSENRTSSMVSGGQYAVTTACSPSRSRRESHEASGPGGSRGGELGSSPGGFQPGISSMPYGLKRAARGVAPEEQLPAEALTSEGGNEELVRGKLKHHRKNYHASTPRKSPRFEHKLDCRNGPVEELPAEALISEGGDAELVRGKVKRPKKNYHTGTPRTSPRFEPKHEYHNGPVEELPAEALISEVGDAELVRGKLKHPRKNYPVGTPRRSPRFEPKHECHNGSVEEMPAEVLTSEGSDAELVRGEVKHSRKNFHTGTPRTSPRFETKHGCCNGSVEELPAEALTSDGADAELVRGKVKHARKDYHTGTSRTSPRFQLKRERRKGPMEELAADHKRFRTLEELIASPDNAESAKTPSTDSLN
ncbi:hypothetical protein VPH35_049300 [Triticum aestivum]|uniref:Uncharacterized protein n=1 Tax=Triticum aestivum TaxID=4565 RepID=A0A077RS24_WHEAT|nr:unnamed protein product [Triticum aestivum]